MSRGLRSLSLAALASLVVLGIGCSGSPSYGFGWGGGLAGLIVTILWIVAIVQVLQSGMSTDKKILWVIVILIIPLVGSILWFLIGRK